MENFDAALRSVTSALIDGLTANTDARMADVAPAIRHFVEQGPDAFHMMALSPWNDLVEAGVRLAFPDVPVDRLSALEFLFAHVDFVSHHLEQQIKNTEGMACPFDKVLWILNHYAMWLSSGEPMPTLPDERQFFHPQSMTVAFWFGFCDHLQGLYMGQPQRYLEDLTLLLASRNPQG